MQIRNSNLNFTSRNPAIRYADDIARRVNCAFPRISKSKFENFKNYDSRSYLNFRLREKTNQMRRLKDSCFRSATHPIQKLLAFITPIQEKRLGNCAESSQLSAIAAKMNGIDNFTIARLRTTDGKSLDHQVLLVQDNPPYIIDSWLGFADYIPQTLEKYKGIYRRNFNINSFNEKNINFEIDKEDIYDRFLRKTISEEDMQKLKKMFPQLIVEGK